MLSQLVRFSFSFPPSNQLLFKYCVNEGKREKWFEPPYSYRINQKVTKGKVREREREDGERDACNETKTVKTHTPKKDIELRPGQKSVKIDYHYVCLRLPIETSLFMCAGIVSNIEM